MPRLTRPLLWLSWLATIALLSGCGVPLQDHPEPLQTSAEPTRTTAPPEGRLAVNIYLLRDDRLQPVERSTDNTSLSTVLALLTAGPTSAEVSDGLETALAPQTFTAERVSDPGVVTIVAPDDFTAISGDDQILATAQLVWTVTEQDPSDRVRITVDGENIKLPTDDGLSTFEVRRTEYMSVAPRPATGPTRPDAESAPPATTTTTP